MPVTQRVLAETSWAGTGAGTFAAILPIYQGIDELAIGQVAPTAAAAIAIEMGWPIFWAMLMAAIALVFFLLRGALRRQRDSYFSMAGAGCIVVTALLSFSNVSFVNHTDLDNCCGRYWHGNRSKQKSFELINVAYPFVLATPVNNASRCYGN